MSHQFEALILFPFLDENTTSANRIRSFIKKLKTRGYKVSIVNVEFPSHYNLSFGHFKAENTDASLDFISVKAELNYIQKLSFSFLKSSNKIWVKILNGLIQFIYGHEVYFFKNEVGFEANAAKGVVIVSGGYFGNFLFASKIADKFGYKLILDYRDPWTFGYARIDGWFLLYERYKKFRQRKMELRIIKRADLISTVSTSLKNFFPPLAQSKVHIFQNGSNNSLKAKIIHAPRQFTVVYAGTIHNDQLIDKAFFQAFNRFRKNKERASIHIYFIGSSKNPALGKKLIKYNLAEIATIKARLPFEELEPVLNNASMFLQLRYARHNDIITSKQADYLAYKKPILLPVSDNGDMAESILKNKAGFVCNGAEDTLAVLEKQYQKFLSNESCVIEQDEEFLRKNTRDYIAKEFVELVDSLF